MSYITTMSALINRQCHNLTTSWRVVPVVTVLSLIVLCCDCERLEDLMAQISRYTIAGCVSKLLYLSGRFAWIGNEVRREKLLFQFLIRVHVSFTSLLLCFYCNVQSGSVCSKRRSVKVISPCLSLEKDERKRVNRFLDAIRVSLFSRRKTLTLIKFAEDYS